VLGFRQIGLCDATADDLVNSGEDNVVKGGERGQELGESLLVPNIARMTRRIGVVQTLDGILDPVFRRRDDNDLGAGVEEDLRRTKANAVLSISQAH
jgi:hypothetical protein